MSLADGKVDVSGDSPLASSAEPEACVGFVPATGVACPLLCSVLGLALIFGEKNIAGVASAKSLSEMAVALMLNSCAVRSYTWYGSSSRAESMITRRGWFFWSVAQRDTSAAEKSPVFANTKYTGKYWVIGPD
jgi:hypothetical protein